MDNLSIVSIECKDRLGLISEIASILFDLGANLEDTVFRVFGGRAKLTAVCDIPGEISIEDLQGQLAYRLELDPEQVSVTAYSDAATRVPPDSITHRITVSGGDRPGLIARLCEVFVQFKANIVRLNAEKSSDDKDATYRIRIDLSVPEKNEKSCLATVANTAGELGLNCAWESV
jgi:glycine cleavage system transcriptional repressor